MIRESFVAFLSLPSLAAAQIQLAWGPQLPGAAFSQILPAANGTPVLIGSQQVTSLLNLSPHSHIALAAATASPPVALGTAPGGNGNDIPHAAAFDPKGNLWIVGETDSDDFPLVNPIVGQKVPYRKAAFVMELDSGYNLLFATYLAGQQVSPRSYSSRATAIAIDSSGFVYIGGQTDETDFPTSSGAFVAGHPGADSFTNTYFYSFVVKIGPAGKLVYSALPGTGKSGCVGGSSCIAFESTFASVSALAVDAAGDVTLAGLAGGADSKTTGYVARLSADGSSLLWNTPVPVSYGNSPGLMSMTMAQDSSGNIDLFGQYIAILPAIPVTFAPPGLFAAQLKADGSGLNYSVNLGQSPDTSAAGILVDNARNVWLAGTSSAPQFPALAAGVSNLGADFILRLDPSGSTAQTVFRLPHGTISAAPAFDQANNLLLLGAQSAVLTLPANYSFNSPAIVGFANAASLAANTGIAPGTLVSIYGFDLPSSPQVIVGGTPATVLYAGPTQINFQVPFENLQATITITSSSGSLSFQPPLSQSIGIFTTDGTHAAALNQDESVNSSANPALPGSIVTFYGTGAIWPSGTQDGAIAAGAMPLDQETNQFEMVDAIGAPQTILYAGAAPGIIEGVFQINVQLTPDALPPFALRCASASRTSISSNFVQVYLKTQF